MWGGFSASWGSKIDEMVWLCRQPAEHAKSRRTVCILQQAAARIVVCQRGYLYVARLCPMSYMHGPTREKRKSLVVPKQRLQVIPMVRVPVQVCHGVEHAGLNCLPALLEQPHDSAPADGGEDGELARVGREWSSRSSGGVRVW